MKKIILITLVFLVFFPVFSEDKNFSAKIDLGDNISKQIDSLAGKLGTTIENLAPKYAERIVIKASIKIWIMWIALGIFFIIMVLSFIFFNHDDLDGDAATVVCTAMFFIMVIIAMFVLPSSYAKREVPDAYVLGEIMSDIRGGIR